MSSSAAAADAAAAASKADPHIAGLALLGALLIAAPASVDGRSRTRVVCVRDLVAVLQALMGKRVLDSQVGLWLNAGLRVHGGSLVLKGNIRVFDVEEGGKASGYSLVRACVCVHARAPHTQHAAWALRLVLKPVRTRTQSVLLGAQARPTESRVMLAQLLTALAALDETGVLCAGACTPGCAGRGPVGRLLRVVGGDAAGDESAQVRVQHGEPGGERQRQRRRRRWGRFRRRAGACCDRSTSAAARPWWPRGARR
jgi:hypothetical protein